MGGARCRPAESEAAFRALWRRFYDTIAIKERENPRCRMSHMPKRYWGVMTEFQKDEEGAAHGQNTVSAPLRLL